MFSRTSRAERTTAQAWEYLADAMASAGESAREAGHRTAGVASDTVSRISDEASRRGARLADKAARKGSKATTRAGRKSSRLAGRAGAKVNAAADEAWTRANAAANALAGRRPPLPWALVLGVGLLGVAAGWAAAAIARDAQVRQAENDQLVLAETEPAPTFDS